MAKLVIGSNKQNGVPAIVKEVEVQPSLGTKTITANGTYNASSDNYDGYSSVTVNVPTVSEPYLELGYTNDRIEHSRFTSRLVALNGFKYLDDYIFYNAYKDNRFISGDVSFQQLTICDRIQSCAHMFWNTRITSFSCPALQTINTNGSRVFTYVCFDCRDLVSFSFPVLSTVAGDYAFQHAFGRCTALTSGVFPQLSVLSGTGAFQYAFDGCTNLTSLSFPALTSTSFGTQSYQFYNMLSGVTGCTVHFPSNLQSVIGSWSDVQNGFGGTNTTVLFDLPQTE